MTRPHVLTFPDIDSAEYAKARYHFLLQILYAETAASDFCNRMAVFAPTEEAKAFLLQQQKEEDLHLDLYTEYAVGHLRSDLRVSYFAKKVHIFILDAINRQDYVESIFIQNFIFEGFNVSLLRELEHHTDPMLSALTSRVLQDEVKHMEFGVSEIRRMLITGDGTIKKKLMRLQRKSLYYAAGAAIDLARDTRAVGIPMGEFSKKTIDEHVKRLQDSGFPLTWFDKAFFKSAQVILGFF